MVLVHLQGLPLPAVLKWLGRELVELGPSQPLQRAFIRARVCVCVCVKEGKGGQIASRSSLLGNSIGAWWLCSWESSVGSWASPGAPVWSWGIQTNTAHGEMQLWQCLCLWWLLVLSAHLPWARDGCWLCWATESVHCSNGW